MSCCATARSPTRRGGASSAISIWKRRASPTASIGGRRCKDFIPPPAKRWGGCRAQRGGWGVLHLHRTRGKTPHPAQRSLALTLIHPPHRFAGGGIRPQIPL